METTSGPESSVPMQLPASAVTRKTPLTIARPGFLVAVTLILGFVIEGLLHGQPLAFGYGLAAIAACAAWIALGKGLGLPPSRSAGLVLACFLAVSLPVAWRASQTLRAVDVLAGIACLLLAGVVNLPGGLHRLSLAEYGVGLGISGIASLAQPFGFLFVDLPAWRERRHLAGEHRRSVGRLPWSGILWGVLLALPALAVFGALFAAADPVFASYLRQLLSFDIDLGSFFGRLFLSLTLSWLALGLARYAFLARRDWWPNMVRPEGSYLGQVQGVTAIALLNGLFLAFVLVQAAYLFGGLDTLARAGLTHSEYARSGFFELCAVAALVLTLVLFLDWLVRSGPGAGRQALNWLHASLAALSLIILTSALYRMSLYVAEYGLTELRLYTTVFMVWLGVVLVLLAVTVLMNPASRRLPAPALASTGGEEAEPAAEVRNRGARPKVRLQRPVFDRRTFAFASLAAGLLIWLGVNLANPDAWIARSNLARVANQANVPVCDASRNVSGGLPKSGTCLDVDYLANHLSLDAVPTLVSGVGHIADPCARAKLAGVLHRKSLELAGQRPQRDWRGTTISERRATQVLAAADASLVTYSVACPK